jgi:6-phosphogluconolactonase (cycloisomerase 2 family)
MSAGSMLQPVKWASRSWPLRSLNPSFLTVDPNHRFLYAVSEDPLSLGPPLDHASYVSAFAIDHATGKLRLLNTIPTGGTSTCHLSMDKTGKFVLLANFGSGSISVVRVKDDGSLGEQTAFVQHLGHGPRMCPSNRGRTRIPSWFRRITDMSSSPI